MMEETRSASSEAEAECAGEEASEKSVMGSGAGARLAMAGMVL